MKIDVKRDCLIIEPENDQDKAFIEDTLKLKNNGDTILLKRINDISLGFANLEKYVLKTELKNEPTTKN